MRLLFVIGLLVFSVDGFHTSSFGTKLQCQVIDASPSSCSKRPLSGSFLWASSPQEGEEEPRNALRNNLRQATGFSLTAFRATWRAATGISLSAMYASALIASSLWVRKLSAAVLGIFPAWFRYFIQPLLVLYYAPLFIIRGISGPTRARAKAKHEFVVDGWKKAIDFAEKTGKDGYKPVYWNENGYFELVKPPKPNAAEHLVDADQLPNQVELADAVAESMDHAMDQGFDINATDA